MSNAPKDVSDLLAQTGDKSGEKIKGALREVITDEPARFPDWCFHGPLAQIVAAVAKCFQVPVSLAACVALGVLSGAIGAGLQVRSGGSRKTKANVFILALAASGTGKGLSEKEISRPLYEVERELIEAFKPFKDEAEAKTRILKSQIKQLEKEAAGDDDAHKADLMQDKLQELREVNEGLSEPCLIVGDSTQESLAVDIESQPGETLASVSGESRGMVDVALGRYTNKSDEAIYLSGYSGDPCKIRRIGREPVCLKNPCLTVMWMVQPDKGLEIVRDQSESGLMPRFLVCDTKAEPEPVPENQEPLDEDARAAWDRLIRSVVKGIRAKGDDPSTIGAEPEAVRRFRDFDNETRRKRRTNGKLHDVAIFVARWAENAWRLALVLHVAKHGLDAPTQELEASTAEDAIELVKWFAEEQIRILAGARENRKKYKLERLEEILKSRGGEVTLRDLSRRNGFSESEVEAVVSAFPERLKIEIRKNPKGGPSSKILVSKKKGETK